MAAVAKHFPGHGNVIADSHLELPVDTRSEAEIRTADLLPFQALVRRRVAAVMPAHVVYTAFDEQPAGFSQCWLRGILREEMGFDGAIISDDLDMAGAAVAGDAAGRAAAAIHAGCDLLLLCNNFPVVPDVLAQLDQLPADGATPDRLAMLLGRGRLGGDFRRLPRHAAAQRWLELLSD
jgi:beta-N-acetylhexosaminidase